MRSPDSSVNPSRRALPICTAASTICGMSVTIASMSDPSRVTTAATIAAPLLAMTPRNATNPTPICWIKYGIMPMNALSATVIAAAPAVPAAARTSKPADRAPIPAPSKSTPAPNTSIAAPSAKNTGTAGISSNAPIPKAAIVPTSISRPLPISSILMDPKAWSTGRRTFSAAAATRRAAAPGSAPLIKYRPPARIRSEPARTSKPFPICAILILPSCSRTGARTLSAMATTRSAAAPAIAVVISFIATAMITNDPASARRPLPICSMERLPIASSALDMTSMAAPRAIMPRPMPTIPLAPPAIAVKPARTRIMADIAPTPLARLPSSMPESFSTAVANMFSETARSRSPAPVLMPIEPILGLLRNFASAPRRTIVPPRPLARLPSSMPESFSTASARILIANANGIRPIAPFMNVPLLADRALATPVSEASRTITAPSPFARSPRFIPPSFSTAPARILIAAANMTRAAPALKMPFPPPFMIPSTASIIPRSCPTMTVIAVSDFVRSPALIVDSFAAASARI